MQARVLKGVGHLRWRGDPHVVYLPMGCLASRRSLDMTVRCRLA